MRQTLISALVALLSLAAGGRAAATDILYSRGDSATVMGTGATKAETYDVAQLLNDKALVGMKIHALRITFPYANGLSEGKAWLSTQLPTIKSQKMQAPDIALQEFTPQKGYTEVVLAEPYTITEAGLYIGYSFRMEASSPARKPVVTTKQTSENGFFLHSSQVYRTAWHDMTSEYKDLALQVVLSGDEVHEVAAGVNNVRNIEGRTGVTTSTTFDVINHGTQGVRSIDYTYEIAGQTGSRHLNISPALPGIFGLGHLHRAAAPRSRKGFVHHQHHDYKGERSGQPRPDTQRTGHGHTLPHPATAPCRSGGVHRHMVRLLSPRLCGLGGDEPPAPDRLHRHILSQSRPDGNHVLRTVPQ